nr:hypothetical protein [Neisseria iguanae]
MGSFFKQTAEAMIANTSNACCTPLRMKNSRKGLTTVWASVRGALGGSCDSRARNSRRRLVYDPTFPNFQIFFGFLIQPTNSL